MGMFVYAMDLTYCVFVEPPAKLKVRHTNTSLKRTQKNAQALSLQSEYRNEVVQQRSSMKQDRLYHMQRRKAENRAVESAMAEFSVDQYMKYHNHDTYFDWRKAHDQTSSVGSGKDDPV